MFKKILKVFMTLVMVISVASFHINNVEADSYKYEESRDVFVADCIINGLLDKSGNRADTYSLISSTILHNYTYKTLAEALMDDKTLVFNSAFWTTVNNSLKGEFSTVFQQRTLFYETIIMDYLAYVDHSEEFESSFNQDRAKFEYDISKKLIEFANDNYENNVDEIIKNQSLSDAIEFSDKYGYISKLNKFSGLVDSIKEKATSAKEYYDGLKSALAIANANVSRVAFLKQMKGQAGENTDFCDAVDEIVGLYEGNYGSLVLYGVEDTAVKHLTEWAWKKLLGKLPSSVSVTLDSIKLGQKTLDFIFNSNDTAENNLKLLILYIIGSYARESATHLRALFNGAQTATNGSNFVNGYLEYVIYQKYATELASGYVQESTYDGLWNQIKNSFNGTDTTYEQFKKYFEDDISISKNYIKQVINYYKLHNSYYGDFSDKSSEVVGSGTSSNINWNLNGNGVLTITGTGKMPDYGSSNQPWYKYKEDIKRVIVGEGITSIGNHAFYQYYNNISKVTIPSTMTSIGSGAFSGCTSLDKIALPEKLTVIGSSAFSGCTSLIDVAIPKAVTTIGSYSFQSCTSLESVVIEANSKKGFETVIGESAFNGCNGLISVTIPGNVISIGNYAFSNCKSLEELTMPEGVKKLGTKIIADTHIEKIKIPSTVTYGEQEYHGESGTLAGDAVLTEVEFAEGMTQIPQYICSGASSVERILIPSTVTSIGYKAFYKCTSLDKIALPENLTKIASYAFDGCASLINVSIPKAVTTIGSYSFQSCTSLESVVIEANSKKGFETVIDESAFNGCKGLISVTIPSNVISIGNYAFSNCKSLEELTIPEGVKKLGTKIIADTYIEKIKIPSTVTYSEQEYHGESGTLAGDTVLTEVEFAEGMTQIPQYICSGASSVERILIPSTVKSIGYEAFYKCTSLDRIALTEKLTVIGSRAFSECTSLIDVAIPKAVTTIGSYSFQSCTSLESVVIEANSKKGFETVIGESAFNGCNGLISVTIPGNVISIENYAFSNCKSLEELTIPEGVKKLGAKIIADTYIEKIKIPSTVTYSDHESYSDFGALAGDAVLTEVQFTEGMTQIPQYICSGASSVERILIPSTVTSIGYEAFYRCTSLDRMALSEKLTVIGSRAFSECTSLIDVAIPKTVTTIGDYSFQNCTSLESVVIEANSKKGFETVIGESAFNGCKGLISVTIPGNVISIENYAFSNCKSLEELTIPEGVKKLGAKIIADTYIEKIKIPSTVTYSDHESYSDFGALAGDAVLTEVQFTEGMTQIPQYICSGASSVERILIPSTVTSIGYEAFYKCTSLDRMALPEKLTVIGSGAFDGCTSLIDVTIPKIVTTIGESSFANCTSLESVVIEANSKKGFETVIGQSAFNGCKSLTSITIPGNVTSIGNYAFSNCNDLIAKVYNNSTGLTYCKNNKINYRIIGSFNKANNIEVQNGTCTNIDESTELKVNELKEGNDYDVVSKSFDNFELYDIAFYKDDQKVTIDGTAVVRIPVEEGMDGNKCKVYYNDNGTFIDMGAVYKDGFMEFKTDHFSQYVITDSELPTFTLGDVNEDGKIDFLDAITVLRYDAEIIQLTDNQMKAAEVNKDGKVDFLDAITILRYDAEIIDSFN